MTEIEDARARLLAAAGPVFAEKGFEHATVREICQSADVNLAAVNYYFGDKQSLYNETVRRAHGSLVERVPLPEWPTDTPAPVKLRGFVHTLLSRMLSRDSRAWQPRLMLREVLNPTEACREVVNDYFRPHFEILVSIIREIVSDDTPQHCCQQIAFSVVGQCLHYRVGGEILRMLISDESRRDNFQVEQLAEHIATFSLAALGQVPAMARESEAASTVESRSEHR